MPLYDADTFQMQRLFEKWVVRDEWLLNEEAVPLLLGIDPESDFSESDCAALRAKAREAILERRLEITGNSEGQERYRVKPVAVYNWASKSGIPVPQELVNLMEFVMKTVLHSPDAAGGEEIDNRGGYGNDRERVLGACLAIVVNYPEECRNSRGRIKPERILALLDENADSLFAGQYPDLSSTAIRDLVNHWIEKLKD